MKGLRFKLRTLFITSALLAGVIYFGWRFSKWHPTGIIAENSFVCQIEDDGQGLLFTITGSNLPIENVVFEIHEVIVVSGGLNRGVRGGLGPPKSPVLFATGQIPIEACFRKQIRVQRNCGHELAIENHDERLIVRLPQFLNGSTYKPHFPDNETYINLGSKHSGKMFGIGMLVDENRYGYEFVMCVNQLPTSVKKP